MHNENKEKEKEHLSSPSSRPRSGSQRPDGSCAGVADCSIVAARIGEDGRYFYFFHMPKTGGLTIHRHIAKRFGAGKVLRPSKNKAFYADVFARQKSVLPHFVSDAHIDGHYASWSLMGGRERRYYKACFWRHPANWYLSLYNYRLHRNSNRIKRPFGFTDFYRSMLRNPMIEHFLLYCGDVPGWAYFFMSDRAKFELACSLAQRFDCFADIAHVDDFLDLIGLEQEQRPPDHTIPAHEKPLAALDETTRIEIERTNAVDYYMHRFAKSEDRARVIDDARRTLNPHFDPRDILRLIVLPYYRFKTWVLPFIAFPAVKHPLR